MKVNVFEIPQKGINLVFKGEEPFVKDIIARLTADEPDTNVRKAAHVHADLRITREGKTVYVEGSAAADFTPPCARCLKPVDTHLEPSFFLTLFPDRDGEGKDEVELKEDELDETTYKGDEIDVAELLNEQILLERPYRILCKEDCKGLCPTCGTDWNFDACDCGAQPASLAFAALKDLNLDAPVAKPAAKPVAKPVAAPIARPVVTPIAKPVATPIAKPVAKPVAKRAAAKAAAKSRKPATKSSPKKSKTSSKKKK